MIFGATIFLIALPLALLPVIFHLLMKRKRRGIEFSTFLFFTRADPRLHAKQRIREALLLALRILFIALMVLALSRPLITWLTGRGKQGAIAFIIDNSASMSMAGDDGEPKLTKAVNAARSILTSLAPNSTASLTLLVDDPAISLPGVGVKRDELLQVLDTVRTTEASGNVASALRRAGAIMNQAAKLYPGTIHVFTDLQKNEWLSSAVPVRGDDSPPNVLVHRIPGLPSDTPNALIESVRRPARLVLPGHVYPLDIVVRNAGESPVSVRFNSEDSLRKTTTRSLTLGAQARQTVRLELTPPEPGTHWLNVWIDGDGFKGDNRACIGLVCNQPAKVFFAGAPATFGLTPLAVSPLGNGRHTALQPVFGEIDDLRGARNAGDPVMAVMTWNSVPGTDTPLQSATLRTFVEAGGALLILPSVTGTVPTGNNPDWLGAVPGPIQTPGKPTTLDVLDRRAPVWGALRDDHGKTAIRRFVARRYHILNLSDSYQPVIGAGFQQPVLAHRRLGHGNIYVSGIAFDPAWSSLAIDPTGAGMLLIHNIALTNVKQADNTLDLVAGETLPTQDGLGPGSRIVSLVGDPLRLTLNSGAMPLFARAGVYSILTSDDSRYVSVRASPKEGTALFITDNNVVNQAS